MEHNELESFREIADQMAGPEPRDWEWVGCNMSQRMFGITEKRAKEYAERHGGTAMRQDDPLSETTRSKVALKIRDAKRYYERLDAARWLVENEDVQDGFDEPDYARHYAGVLLGRAPTAEDWDTIGDTARKLLEI